MLLFRIRRGKLVLPSERPSKNSTSPGLIWTRWLVSLTPHKLTQFFVRLLTHLFLMSDKSDEGESAVSAGAVDVVPEGCRGD